MPLKWSYFNRFLIAFDGGVSSKSNEDSEYIETYPNHCNIFCASESSLSFFCFSLKELM